MKEAWTTRKSRHTKGIVTKKDFSMQKTEIYSALRSGQELAIPDHKERQKKNDRSTIYQRRTGYPPWGLLQESKLVRCLMVAK